MGFSEPYIGGAALSDDKVKQILKLDMIVNGQEQNLKTLSQNIASIADRLGIIAEAVSKL